MTINRRQIEATTARYRERERQRERNKRLIQEGLYLEVDSPDRVEKFLARHGFSERDASEFLRQGVGLPRAAESVAGRREPNALERVLGTNDLMGVAFLEKGLQVARSIARIWVGVAAGRPAGYGTGFLISPRLLMTNHHVLEDTAIARRSQVEFDYQIGMSGVILPTTTFTFDPDTFFFADADLDYAVVAVQEAATSPKRPRHFGWNPLIEEEGKAIVGQWLNIIQHPNGEPKQLGLRENQFLDRLDNFLHYATDTAPGSSGSAVYNDRWEVVALHHSGVWATNAAGQILSVDGGVWDESMGEHRIKWIANEGVRISKIVAHLRGQQMTVEQRALFEEIFMPPELRRDASDERQGDVTPAVPRDSTVRVEPDGAATWTVPISISVRVGGQVPAATRPAEGPVTTVVDRAAVGPPPGTGTTTDEQAVLAAARRELGSRSDVVDVRLGYVFADGWITNERALVVTVRQKHSPAALREAQVTTLPRTFMGLPVDVTGPSIDDLVRLSRGPAVAEAAMAEVTVLPDEITYVEPVGTPLERVTGNMRVVAHVSPDAGWRQLRDFLAGTQRSLTVGMYDFGAPHIVGAIEDLRQAAGFDEMTLVMQKGESVGEGTKADDLHDDETVDRLRSALGNKFQNTWVKIGRVNGWVASSYHIKVAVRDHKAFWLSSGNWQSSNQPMADPLGEAPQRRKWLDEYNREWHAIVEHAGLARTLEAHLRHDFQNNQGTDGREELALPDVLVPESLLLPTALERAGAFQYFAAFDEKRPFTVTPLLTPDNYHEHVLALVDSAMDELLIQNQTFNAPGRNHEKLRELIEAVMAKQQAGVQVRVIFRVLIPAKARQVLEDLKDFGFDTDSVRVQRNCHTKGIVVDRKRVLLGSQNWSNDGVSVNRDASLLFDDEPLAQYFATIFDHDWNNLARRNVGSEWFPIETVAAGEPTPAGKIRLGWKDYMEMF